MNTHLNIGTFINKPKYHSTDTWTKRSLKVSNSKGVTIQFNKIQNKNWEKVSGTSTLSKCGGYCTYRPTCNLKHINYYMYMHMVVCTVYVTMSNFPLNMYMQCMSCMVGGVLKYISYTGKCCPNGLFFHKKKICLYFEKNP